MSKFWFLVLGASLSYKSTKLSVVDKFLVQYENRLELSCQVLDKFLDLFEMYGWEANEELFTQMPLHTVCVVLRRIGELKLKNRYVFGFFES